MARVLDLEKQCDAVDKQVVKISNINDQIENLMRIGMDASDRLEKFRRAKNIALQNVGKAEESVDNGDKQAALDARKKDLQESRKLIDEQEKRNAVKRKEVEELKMQLAHEQEEKDKLDQKVKDLNQKLESIVRDITNVTREINFSQ